MSREYDIVIKTGRVLDGTGNPYYVADIGISNGKIIRIGKGIDPALAPRIIQAAGLVVSPGFFDAHSHDDLYLMFKPTCDDKILQGVTTDVIGNCGISVTPLTDEHKTEMISLLGVVGGQYTTQADLNMRTFADYLRKLEALKPGINVLPLVGHCTVRVAVMAYANRAPTDAELRRMKDWVSSAMEDGAFGLSTGLIYAPGSYAKTEEIIQLAKVVSQFNGIYTSHIRSEGDAQLPANAETIRIGEEAGVPVHISHHKALGKGNWGKSMETLRMMAEARARGVEVTCDQYPYTAGSTFLAAVLPQRAMEGKAEVVTEKLRDPKYRAELIETIEKGSEEGWENLIKGTGFEGIVISRSSKHGDYLGKSIAEIAKKENRSPYDVIFDLVIEEGRGLIVILFNMADDDIHRIMRTPWTMVGSDGIPSFGAGRAHPRQTGTFPRVLGRYVREKGVLTLEEAIRKMTSLPAQTFGVKGKGLLKEGFDADLVIFNPETIIDKATYEDPNQPPEGIRYVLVNGKIAVEDGRVTGVASGRVLRKQK
jgi:N-acyl-D-amino-acid deacylase